MKLAHYLLLATSLIGTLGLPSLATKWLHAHLSVYMVFVAAAIVLHAVFPSIFSDPSDADKKNTGLGGAGVVLLAFGLLLGSAQPGYAQTSTPPAAPAPLTNLYAAGISYNNAGTPSIAGTALYAHSLNDGSGTYAFTVIDAVPTSYKPFNVTSNISAGVAQKAFTIGKVSIFIPTAAGISFNGTNTGWAWSTGALAPIKVKGNYYLLPSVRVVKSSVSNGTGYQLIPGILFGWGQ